MCVLRLEGPGCGGSNSNLRERKKTHLSQLVVGWEGLEQRGSDGPAAAARPETQLDLLIEPHITPHALYYQTLPEGKKLKG